MHSVCIVVHLEGHERSQRRPTVERVTAVDEGRKGFGQRRSPLEGLTPADFVENGNWPYGALREPPELRASGLSPAAAYRHVKTVRPLLALAQDYEEYLRAKRTTQKSVAKELGVSTRSLSTLRTRRAWPTLRVFVLLRDFVPPKQR